MTSDDWMRIEREILETSPRPIIFSAPMVRAILDGTKTQTRRLAKVVDMHRGIKPTDPFPGYLVQGWKVGRRLWVRESYAPNDDPPSGYVYRADGRTPYYWGNHEPEWRNPLFMPKNASRIHLEITEIRLQRLHEITQEDARAEGTHELHADFDAKDVCVMAKSLGCSAEDPLPWYALLWDQINGKRAPWASNPMVFAITFKRLT